MKCVALLLTLLPSLWISGCGTRGADVETRHALSLPQVLKAAPCPKPAPPVLPVPRKELLLDAPDNVNILKERDSRMRRYIGGLRATIDCYESQGD